MNNNTNNNFNDKYNNYGDNNNVYSNTANPYQNTNPDTNNNVYSSTSHSYPNTNDTNVYSSTANPYQSQNSSANTYHPESEYSYAYQRNNAQDTLTTANVYSSSVAKEKPKKKKGNFLLKAIVAGLCFGIVAGSVMVGMNYAGNKMFSSNASGGNTVSTTSSIKTVNDDGKSVSTTYDVSKVVDSVMPAMVSINIKGTQTVQNPYSDFFNFGFGFGGNDSYQQEISGSGSGIIISQNDSELLIVTNNHVIENANEINVTFNDKSTSSAQIRGTEPDYDLAVISVKLSDISQDTKNSIAIAKMGNSDTLKLGQPAVAIRNALGYGQSVTVGYISALEREVQMTDNTMTLIQTDAAINPGNSGGALLDMNGNVIGINSAKYSDTDVEGMGYAIPISDATPIIEDLINHTNHADSNKAYLGISGTDVTDSYSQSFGLPTGVYVSKVTSSSPADVAGIQAGDIITKFNGDEVKTMSSLQAKLKTKKPGETVEITVQRQQRNGGYKDVTLSVKLGAKSDAPSE